MAKTLNQAVTNGPEESLPPSSIAYQPGLMRRISAKISLTKWGMIIVALQWRASSANPAAACPILLSNLTSWPQMAILALLCRRLRASAGNSDGPWVDYGFSISAQARATDESGEAAPGIVAHPPFSTNVSRSQW
jgi:hypothetical protein